MKTYTFEIPVTGTEIIDIKASSLAEAINKLVGHEGEQDSYVPEYFWSEVITEQNAVEFILK